MSAPTTSAIGSITNTFGREPWEYAERLRGEGDVVWDDGVDAWLVSSHELIREIGSMDEVLWASPYAPDPDGPAPAGLDRDDWLEFYGAGSARFIGLTKGEDQARQHRWMTRALSKQVLSRWQESLIAPVVQTAIDQFAARGHGELFGEFSDHVAPAVMASIMGLPHDDPDWMRTMRRLADSRVAMKQVVYDGAASPEFVEEMLGEGRAMQEHLLPFVRARRDGTGDDLISMIWAAGDDFFGPGWSEIDVLGAAVGVWEAGSHTTRIASSSLLYLLLTDRSLQEAVRAGGKPAVRNLVEESLRLYGPVFYRMRVAIEDVQLGPVLVAKGQRVLALMTPGGRDPAHYACPYQVDLERPSPRDHFSFWQGRRACAGQALARAELETVLEATVDRLRDLRLDPDAEPPGFHGSIARWWAPLNARWTAG